MAPTPNLNTHLLQVRYVIQGMQHKLQFHCSAAESSGAFYLLDPLLGPSALWTTWLQDMADELGPAVPTGTTSAGATLYERVEGMLVPVDASTYTLTPAGGTAILANGMVATWRDAQNTLMRLTLLETGFGGPTKFTTIGDIPSGGMHDFLEAMDLDGAGLLSRYWHSLNGNVVKSFISCISDTNEKLRRLRGLK